MPGFGEIAVSALICLGAFFLFVGSFGLAKLPDLMRRLHGPTKATTLGIGALLIASMLYFILEDEIVSLQELLITTFLFLTAPVTALMVAKAHILLDKNDQEHLPPTGREAGWSVLDAPQTDEVKKS
ncbi:MAG: Na+/H+ antiporter subunit G [Hyphomicrobiaceae bacterium]|nr:Na+/H+ antiporter subunit G [Hyphomicrobiaceae bacterium]